MASLGGSARRSPRGQDFGYLSIGGGDVLDKIRTATVSVNPASIATLTKAGTAVTVAGVEVGDIVVAVPPAALEDDLIPAGAVVTDANEVTIYLYNAAGTATDGAAGDWTLLIFEVH